MGRCFQVTCQRLLEFPGICLLGLPPHPKPMRGQLGHSPFVTVNLQFVVVSQNCLLPSPVRFLQRYVQRETESMQSSKSNVTASTLGARQKKMAEMCSLIKYFIRCANKRECTVVTMETRWASLVQKTSGWPQKQSDSLSVQAGHV